MMINQNNDIESKFLKLKRVSTIGYMAILVWFSVSAGAMFLLQDETIGWVSILLGLAILVLPLTNPFRRYWGKGNVSKAFPIIIFVANIILVFIYGSVFLTLISDPFVLYSTQTTYEVYVWGGAAVLSVIALSANLGVFIFDRGSSSQDVANQP